MSKATKNLVLRGPVLVSPDTTKRPHEHKGKYFKIVKSFTVSVTKYHHHQY